MRAIPLASVLAATFLLQSCGGGDDSAPPAAAPPPAAPVPLVLDANTYQGALSHALWSANTGFAFAKLGADTADQLFGRSLVLPPVFLCPVSGTASIEFNDRNRNDELNPSEGVYIFLNGCNSGTAALTGVIRIEVTSATRIPDGREYQFGVTIDNLVLASTAPGVGTTAVNFAGIVNYTRTTDFDHYVLSSGDYSYVHDGDTRTATDLLVDYLQRYDTQNYDYLIRGTVGGTAIQGQYRVSTLTGTIGAYPGAGQIMLSGGAGSTALLSEEGAAAANGAAVLVSVDSNGDGVADSSVPEFAWLSLTPPVIFSSLRNQADVAALPIP